MPPTSGPGPQLVRGYRAISCRPLRLKAELGHASSGIITGRPVSLVADRHRVSRLIGSARLVLRRRTLVARPPVAGTGLLGTFLALAGCSVGISRLRGRATARLRIGLFWCYGVYWRGPMRIQGGSDLLWQPPTADIGVSTGTSGTGIGRTSGSRHIRVTALPSRCDRCVMLGRRSLRY